MRCKQKIQNVERDCPIDLGYAYSIAKTFSSERQPKMHKLDFVQFLPEGSTDERKIKKFASASLGDAATKLYKVEISQCR
jgi:hypothetical protein